MLNPFIYWALLILMGYHFRQRIILRQLVITETCQWATEVIDGHGTRNDISTVSLSAPERVIVTTFQEEEFQVAFPLSRKE